jgi:hypothetical protein
MKNCNICNKLLTGRQVKYCSNACKQKSHYLRVKHQTNTYHSQTVRGLRRKMLLVNHFGGKCSKCSYCKNIAALEFHHTRDKLFQLDMRNLSNRKLGDLLLEASKCNLFCANCHREQHNPELDFSNIISIIGDSLEKSNDANRMNSVKPLNMAIPSQATDASVEGVETNGTDGIASDNTVLASDILTCNDEDDDIVHGVVKTTQT